MKTKIYKPFLIILLIAALLLVLLFSAKALARKHCYEFIQPGMSYNFVVAIMGCEGEDFDTSMNCYWWYLDDGSMLQVFYDYEGPKLTNETLNKIRFEDYFVIKQVYLFKPQIYWNTN